ncbi:MULTISPECIES: hypothetical protein [unclassified Streptomyces]|uniref:hypothetical protein n=1 Tax=unclassified Streptomyces TaxID=2593676 RepID=UPI0022703E52|nr:MULTISPECIES: hypothetical protein [unclassified Streptomyces]MCY0919619.1 hypothetical protein [Streptomyces sp. H27-G5]MCY0957199.1 hypothetical protein [Streptomyces sp. H27-H5]
MERTVRLALTSTGGTVEVDGHDISDTVSGFTLTQRAGEPPAIALDLALYTAMVEGVATLAMKPGTDNLLTSFGWTRPGQAAPAEPVEQSLADRIRALHTPSREACYPYGHGGRTRICEGCSAGNPWEAPAWPCPTLALVEEGMPVGKDAPADGKDV